MILVKLPYYEHGEISDPISFFYLFIVYNAFGELYGV